MFLDLKPTILVLNIENSEKEHINSLVNPYSNKTYFLKNFSQEELTRIKPQIIIFFTCPNEPGLVFKQVSMLRSFPNLSRTTALLVEDNGTPFSKRMALETGFDYIIPNSSINMLPNIINFFTDISEYRHIHDALFLENAFSCIDLPIVVCNEEGIIQFSNTSFKHFVTRTNSKLTGMSIYDFIHSKKLHTVYKHAQIVAEKLTSFSNIPVTVTSLNQNRDCFLTISYFPKIEKHELSILYVLHEYTSTKKAEEKAYILQSVLDKSTNSILITNAKGTIVYANPRMLKKINKKGNTLLGESANILPKQYHIHSREDISLYTKLGFTYFNEYEEICKNGDIILEKEKILPLNYSFNKKKGHLVRISEYIKKQNLSNSAQKIWIKTLTQEMAKNIKDLNCNFTQNSNNHLYSNDMKNHSLTRSFEQMKGFIDIQSNEPFTLKRVPLNTIIKNVLAFFPDYPSAKFPLRLQDNLPFVYVDSSKIVFAILTMFCEEIKKNQHSIININTSLHHKGVQLVIRTVYDTKSDICAQEEKISSEYLWIAKQVFMSQNIKFAFEKECLGNSIFCIFPIASSGKDLKKEEKSQLL